MSFRSKQRILSVHIVSNMDGTLSGRERRFNLNSKRPAMYKALESFLLNMLLKADVEVTQRYKDIDSNKVTSLVSLLHEEHPEQSSVDCVVAIICNMHEPTGQYSRR